NLNMELEKVVKERDELKDKIAKWEESTKNLDKILSSQLSARDKTGLGYVTQLNELSQTNDANTKKSKSASESVVSNPKINRDRVIIEDWNSDDEEEVNEVQTVRPETQISQEPKLKNVVNTGQRNGKPVWDNTKRVKHQTFSKYPHLSKTFVPSGVLTRTGLHRPSVSIARPVYATRPIYLRMDNVRPRGSCSPIKRSYYTKPAFRPKDLKQDVKTFGVQNMTTAGTRAVVNTGKSKLDTDLKKSRWVWRPKGNYLDHVSKDIGSFMLKKVKYVDPNGISKSVMAWIPKR
ncbi:hypothetical protein Tco_0061908, partial [Tanacetum coccineum]